jgi:DNA-binding NarL/FixJ family response regulator
MGREQPYSAKYSGFCLAEQGPNPIELWKHVELKGFIKPLVRDVEPCLASGRGGFVLKEQTPPIPGAISARIRCIVADDHALLRQGVRRLLEDESDLEVVAEAANAADALKLVLEHRPDLLLMDVGMPGPSSFEAARIIDEKCPKTRVIFLTMHEDQEYVIQGLQAGAAGYLLKDTPAHQLISSLREVHAGGRCVSPELLGPWADGTEAASVLARTVVLTPREREIMKLLAEGNTARKVASLLGLSVKTVEAHKFNLMRKLDIHNKAQLVTRAIQKKIVNLPFAM